MLSALNRNVMNSGAMCEHPGNVSTVDRLRIISEVRLLVPTTADDDSSTMSILSNNDCNQSFNTVLSYSGRCSGPQRECSWWRSPPTSR